ncbi:hypothetical protein O0L34_g18643 [Tuta absoluta]|nr:hypothetical protein O0L34_g18643 [Tuta absoluta]
MLLCTEGLTPPLKPTAGVDSDDDLDLILGDIDGILSDDEDTGRFKEKSKQPEPPKPKPQTDLRSKLPPKTKSEEKKPPKQRIVFGETKTEKEKPDRKRKERTPPKKTGVSSSTKTMEEKKITKAKERTPPMKESKMSMRQRITFEKEQAAKQMAEKEQAQKEKETNKSSFSNRRVILQRKVSQTEKSVFTRIEVKSDPTKPNPGIFSRAVRTLNSDKSRIVINKKQDEPQIEYESDSEVDEDKLLQDEIGNLALVTNLPHGMTDTRLKTLAGSDVQSLTLDKEERSAKITFKTTIAAENFKKKFNSKMVAASRLVVTLK